MAKDRARPFSRKHRRYWIPVTGGMILIGLIDVALGYCSYTKPSDVHERILYNVPTVGGGSGTNVPPLMEGVNPVAGPPSAAPPKAAKVAPVRSKRPTSRIAFPPKNARRPAACEIATVFYLSFVHTLGWDGLLNWEIKARYAFANGGVLPAAYFSDTGRAFSHPEYPLAIPFTELWLYFWVGESNQFYAKTIFPTFYVAGAFLIAAFASRLSRTTWLGLLMAALMFFVPQITVEVGCASAGYADFPLSVFYLAAAGCLFCAFEQGNDVFFRLGFAPLLIESEASGYRFLPRVNDEWASGVNRFTRPARGVPGPRHGGPGPALAGRRPGHPAGDRRGAPEHGAGIVGLMSSLRTGAA